MTKTTKQTSKAAVERFEAARANVARVEAEGRSTSTVNRAWRAYFAAEDALKAQDWLR